MQDIEKDLETINQSRSGTIEVRIPIEHMDLIASDAGKFRKPGFLEQDGKIDFRSLDRISTARDHEYIGIQLNDTLPRNGPRSFASLSQTLNSTCELNQFRIPMTGTKGRIDPFENQRSGLSATALRSPLYCNNSLAQLSDDLLRSIFNSSDLPNHPKSIEKIRESRRFEAYDRGIDRKIS